MFLQQISEYFVVSLGIYFFSSTYGGVFFLSLQAAVQYIFALQLAKYLCSIQSILRIIVFFTGGGVHVHHLQRTGQHVRRL